MILISKYTWTIPLVTDLLHIQTLSEEGTPQTDVVYTCSRAVLDWKNQQ